MPPTGFFIDANLLLLLIVGSVGRDLISKHRRLRRFTVEDFDRLINLLAQHGDPERSRFFDRLQFIIQESKEIVVASTVASRNNAFKRLGLTDSVLLEVATAETPLVTVDLDLYLAALVKGQDTAVNFTYLQDL